MPDAVRDRTATANISAAGALARESWNAAPAPTAESPEIVFVPSYAIDDGRWAEKRIGPDRIKRTYAFRTFLDNGVRLALGTDWTVAPLDPLQTIYAAVTRATLDGKNPDGWVPEQKMTVAEAVEGYTAGSAYAALLTFESGPRFRYHS